MTEIPSVTPNETLEQRNKRIVLEAFDALFNKRDYVKAKTYWSPDYIQHASHLAPGRDGLFDVVRSAPDTMGHEAGLIMAEGDFVMVHSRFGNDGRPDDLGSYPRWVAVDILRLENGVLVEHWDVIQPEATSKTSLSGFPMFGDAFPDGPHMRPPSSEMRQDS